MNTHNTQTPINTRAAWRPFLRPVARVLIAAQLALVLQPLSVLAQEAGATPYNPTAQAQLTRLAQLNQTIGQAKANQNKTPADAVSDKLGQAQELVARLKSPYTPDKAARHRQLKDLLAAIQAGAADVRAEFAATKVQLQGKKLPAEIIARHDEAVAQFEQRVASFGQIIAQAASDDERVQKLADFFDKFPNKRKPGKIDPKKLPWSTPQPNTRMPAETQTAWYQNLYADQKIRLAQAGGTSIGPLQFNIPPEPGQAPTVADLAETDEVQLTDALRAKAKDLGNNPVNIYNWVRNNIEWAPTNGAIQSAQDTLDKKRGNATDTASLLIALLRAANIPARYQYGTIDVDAQKAMNWVGGATVPQAALQILNQGGIAARGIATGGRITTVRMEHVWVQAYANWTPSRGARNASEGQHPNTNALLNRWVPLDASFKQYTYTQGMDLKTAVPLDANALLQAAQQGATVNEAEGWVQNLNQAAIQNQMAEYQTKLQNYIKSTPTGANSTVGDVIGKKIIPVSNPQLLSGVILNTTVVQSLEASSVPSAQQHKFTYRLYANDYDQANDTRLLSFTEKTSRLVGKRLTLTYIPATPADADLIASYLPKPHADGSPILPSELPTGLPGYLIKLKAQINLDGQVVAQAAQSVQMGADMLSTGGFTQLYNTSHWDLTSEESSVAGNTTAMGTSAGGIGETQLTTLKNRLTATQTQLQTNSVAGLTGEQLSGDLLTATIWSWFAASESHSRLSQNQANMVESPGLSYGLFHTVANPIYSWGVIRKVTFPGVSLDIGHVRNMTWSKDNNPAAWAAYNRMRGAHMSALEHSVPDQFFNDAYKCNSQPGIPSEPALPTCPQGVSAVKAIALGAQAGQKIFTVTAQVYQNNPNIVDTSLSAHSPSTQDRVRQALAVGYEVTIHEAPITQDGWKGAGFMVIDPATGAGGYLIEGGSNGDFRADDEAGTSITYTTVNPNPTAGTMFLMSGLVAEARVSLAARQALAATIARVLPTIAEALVAAGPVATSVLTVSVVLLIIVVIWQIVAASAAESEDIRQQVISNAQANPLTKEWHPDNCKLANLSRLAVPRGWKRHTYICLLAPSQQISRLFPIEIPSPTPVPCVPGLWFTAPERDQGDLISPETLQCVVNN
ncbi:MAG: transglutaminase domain protein [Ramlibacter sp.]|nr:transglutaminase domain protein [Ramlibacter sp.]